MLWRLKTHHEYPKDTLSWYRNHHLIALGWGHVGNLKDHKVSNEGDIRNLYWNTYGNTGSTSNFGNFTRSLWQRFLGEMEIGHRVILVTKRRVCVARITGDYFFDENYPPGIDDQALGGYCHRRTAEIAGNVKDADTLWYNHNLEPGTNIYDALIKLISRNQ